MTATRDRQAPCPWWFLGGCFCLGFLSQLPAFGLFHAGINDEAVVSLGAVRMLGGQWPYVGFDTRFGPGSYVLTWLFFLLVGPQMTSVRSLMAVVCGLIAMVTGRIGWNLFENRYFALLPVVFVTAGSYTQFPILNYHWFGVLFYLLGLERMIAWLDRGQVAGAVGNGLATALACWTLQSDGAALVLFNLLALIVLRRRVKRSMLAMAVGTAVAASLLFWGPFLVKAGWAAIYRQNVTNALEWTVPFNASPYNLHHITDRWASFIGAARRASPSPAVAVWALQGVSYLLVWSCGYLGLYPILAVSLYLCWKRRWPTEMLIWLSLLCLTAVCHSRQDMLYVNYLTPLAYLSACCWGARSRRVRHGLVAVAALFVLQWGFTIKDSMAAVYPIITRRGTLWTANRQTAALEDQMYDLAAKLTPPGTPVFAYPYAPGFLYLSGTRDVSRFSILVPLLYSPRDLTEAAREVKEAHPKCVYRIHLGLEMLSGYPTVDRNAYRTALQHLDQRMLAPFELCHTFGLGKVYCPAPGVQEGAAPGASRARARTRRRP